MTTWHVDPSVLSAWVEGTSGPLASASIEQHLVHCEQCRAAVAGLVRIDDVPGAWDDVLAEVAGDGGLVERLLVRLGLRAGDAVVVGAAPVLRIAWATGLAAVLGFILVASLAGHDRGLAVFLALAPLLPVAGVAAAYGPSADPSYELVVAAPYRMIRLVLLRSAAVLLTAVPITVAAGLLLPLDGATAVAWVLPSLAFTLVVLGAGSWVDPWAAAVTVGAGWVAAVAVSARYGNVLAVVAPTALVGYVVLIVAGALILALATPAWRLDGQWSPMQQERERT